MTTVGYTDCRVNVVGAPLVIVVDVLPAKGAQGAATEEAIVGVDIVHVIHETEWSVGLDEIGAVHPGDGLSGKAPDVIHAGLVTTVEVLAGELGDTDRQLEGGGPLLDVGLEVGELDVVPVNWHLVNATVSTARLEEAGDPIEAIGGGGSARASKSISRGSKRLDVAVPGGNSVGDRSVTLGWLVDLIHTVSVGSITGLGVLNESLYVARGGIPKHDADGEAGVLDGVGDGGGPEMEHYDVFRS